MFQGTVSNILERRDNDNNNDGLLGYSIKSVHNWGENPKGRWTVEVLAHVSIAYDPFYNSTFHWSLLGYYEIVDD